LDIVLRSASSKSLIARPLGDDELPVNRQMVGATVALPCILLERGRTAVDTNEHRPAGNREAGFIVEEATSTTR
jgi:hypothetical protein